MVQQINVVIFDCDGTLVDSERITLGVLGVPTLRPFVDRRKATRRPDVRSHASHWPSRTQADPVIRATLPATARSTQLLRTESTCTQLTHIVQVRTVLLRLLEASGFPPASPSGSSCFESPAYVRRFSPMFTALVRTATTQHP